MVLVINLRYLLLGTSSNLPSDSDE